MNTNVIADQFSEVSPQSKARLAGVFFLLTTLAGIIAEIFVSAALVVPGDAAATATNILSHESLFRLGFAIYLVEMACQITMTALFYDLLRPVSRSLALITVFLNLTGCIVKTLSRLFYIAPLLVLRDAPYLGALGTEQSQALARLSLKLNDQGVGIALVFFGLATLLKGYLIFRSTFLPKFLGVLGILGGMGWLCFLYPPFAYRLLPVILLVGLLGAVLQIFWLLVFGVNEARWKEQYNATAASFWR